MPKIKSLYICQSCSAEFSQWTGQCLSCGEWNTLVETVVEAKKPGRMGSGPSMSGLARPKSLTNVEARTIERLSSNLEEFDRVLGGGFVPGQVILLAGEPGIGKSTLLTQIPKSMPNSKILYVSGEESVEQIKIRANRMGVEGSNLFLLPETNVDMIIPEISSSEYDLVIVDSIQTLYSEELTGMAGSVGQVKGSAQKLTNAAKSANVPVIIIGHVTKEGTVAGPKVLEHIIDTVLYLEGDSQHLFRILKTTKNRFGAVSEVGIFEMSEKGMVEVKNPSKIFLSEKLTDVSGSCVVVVMEGQRPVLFEIQALTVKTSFGYPRRTTSGFNQNRLMVLIAVLEKTCGLNFQSHDVYLNVAGGFKVSEYAADLAVCLALASSIKDKPLQDVVAAFGEVGLSGEIRKVTHMEKREKESKKLGYAKVLSPSDTKTVREAIQKGLKK